MATPPRHSRTEANCPRVRATRPAAAEKEVPAPNPSIRIPGVAKRPLLTSRFTFQTLAGFLFCVVFWVWGCLLLCGVFVSCFASVWNPEFSAQFGPRWPIRLYR